MASARIIPWPRVAKIRPGPEPITSEQRRYLSEAVRNALSTLGGPVPEAFSCWAWNRLQVRFNIKSPDELSQEQFEAAMEEIERMHADLMKFTVFQAELTEFLAREVIGAGTPWIPTLAEHWQAKMRMNLPKRPDWMAMAGEMDL